MKKNLLEYNQLKDDYSSIFNKNEHNVVELLEYQTKLIEIENKYNLLLEKYQNLFNNKLENKVVVNVNDTENINELMNFEFKQDQSYLDLVQKQYCNILEMNKIPVIQQIVKNVYKLDNYKNYNFNEVDNVKYKNAFYCIYKLVINKLDLILHIDNFFWLF